MSKQVYLHVGGEWSYNFIGGIVVDYDLTVEAMDHLYVLAAEYIITRHKGSLEFGIIREQLEDYAIGVDYCLYYFKQLYMILSSALHLVVDEVKTIVPVVNHKSDDLDGFLLNVS